MESQQFSLSNYINVQSFNLDDLLKKLYDEYNIMSKDYPQHNMIILYNKYQTKKKSQLEKECRSIVIDRSSYNILCYSCPTPIYNIEAVNYMWKNQNSEKDSYICYEGPLVSLFFNNKWFVSTRKCIYDNESEESGQFKMFMDVLRKDGYTLDSFTSLLDKNSSYHFVLIHHLNENVVNYKKDFGEEYAKLCFIFARNGTTHVEIKSENIDCVNLSDNIFLPKKIEDYDKMTNSSLQNITELPSYEGIIIKMNNNILKIQTPAYQFHKAIGSEKNMFRGFLYLYQNNILKQFFETNAATIGDKFRKVVNPMNTNETYDMVGMIDCLFKVLTSELLFLFNKLYDSNGNQLNNSLYLKLPDEYKNILFQIRGVLFHNKKKGTSTGEYIQLKDVYNLLKTIDVNVLESFIRTRKLMLNWTRLEKSPESLLFFDCLYHCDKIFYKLASIYTIKLFPEIMQDDIPFKNITIN